jgi:hypothetical protein
MTGARKKLARLGAIGAILVGAIVLACREDAPTQHRHGPDITLSGPSFNAAFPGADSLNCSGYPTNEGSVGQTTKRVWLESQAWWDSTGVDLQETAEDGDGIKEGEHIHVGMCWPVVATGPDSGYALVVFDSSAQLKVDVRQLVHNTPGRLTQPLRIQQEGTTKITIDTVRLGPNAGTPPTGELRAWHMNQTIDFSNWATIADANGVYGGLSEVRFVSRMKCTGGGGDCDTTNAGANDPEHADFYNSTSFPLCVQHATNVASGEPRTTTPAFGACDASRSGKPTFNTDSVIEGKGWHESNSNYRRAWFKGRLPVHPIDSTWTFKARLEQSGPVGIFIDPDFHGESGTKHNGIVVTYGPNAGGTGPLNQTTININTLTVNGGNPLSGTVASPAFHRLALVSCTTSGGCGVLVIGFWVANP